MKLRTLAVLFGVVTILAGLAWRSRGPVSGGVEPGQRPPFSLQPGDAQQLEIRLTGEASEETLLLSGFEPLEGRKQLSFAGDGTAREWWLNAPVTERANSERVQALLTHLEGLVWTQTLSDEDPELLGLLRPLMSLRWSRATASDLLEFGRKVPATNECFVRLNGSYGTAECEVLGLFRRPRESASDWSPVDVWRDERAWRFEVQDLSGFELGHRNHLARMEQKQGRWYWQLPFQDRVDPQKTRYLTNDLKALTVENYLDLAAWEVLDTEALALTWLTPWGEEDYLAVRCPTNNSPAETSSRLGCIFKRSDNVVFEAQWPLVEELFAVALDPTLWRSPRLTAFSVSEVDQWSYALSFAERAAAAEQQRFVRVGVGWQDGEGDPRDSDRIEGVLALLEGVAATGFDPTETSLAEGADDGQELERRARGLQMFLRATDGSQEELTFVEVDEGREYLAASSTRPVGLRVSAQDFKSLLAALTSLPESVK